MIFCLVGLFSCASHWFVFDIMLHYFIHVDIHPKATKDLVTTCNKQQNNSLDQDKTHLHKPDHASITTLSHTNV